MKLLVSTINNANYLVLITKTDVFSINLPFYNLKEGVKTNIGDSLLHEISCFLQEKQINLKEINVFCAFLGPSLFTNVRLGIIVSNTLALTLNKQVMGVSNISYLINCAKEKISEYKNINFIAILINIGKSGAILCIADINGNIILDAQYLESNEVVEFFKHNKTNNYLAIGDKLDLLEGLTNCYIIKDNMFNNIDYIANYIKKCYNSKEYLVALDNFKQLEPIYIKEPDITIKQVKN